MEKKAFEIVLKVKSFGWRSCELFSKEYAKFWKVNDLNKRTFTKVGI